MMYNLILQIVITLFGILAIGLLSLKHKARKYGFVAGLISDVFWVWWVLLTGNYIFLVFTSARILCYLNGIRNYFLKKGLQVSWGKSYYADHGAELLDDALWEKK